MSATPYIFSEETLVCAIAPGAGAITLAGILGAFVPPARSSGRYVFRFEATGGDLTVGDGTYAHAIAIVGQRDGSGATSPIELVGFAGILMGGAAPQIPMKNAGGANPRSFSQIVELADGFSKLGIAGFAAAETTAVATLNVYVSAILS